MDYHDQSGQKIDTLIIGGGIAGLTAANRLSDKKMHATVLDAGDYPCHRICGEYLSHEALEMLKVWAALPQVTIKEVKFHFGKKSFRFSLPIPARGANRFHLEHALAERAKKCGQHLLTNSFVETITYHPQVKHKYVITLKSGKKIKCQTLFISTKAAMHCLFGKKTNQKKRFLAAKAHFQGLKLTHCLEMFCVPHGYLGLSPISKETVNVACLVDLKGFKAQKASFDEYLETLQESDLGRSVKKILDQGTNVFGHWLCKAIPDFSLKSENFHSYQDLYLIGDANASIAPISGDGLAMAVTSALLAADCADLGKYKQYQYLWYHKMHQRLQIAKWLHRLMLTPSLAKALLIFCSKYTSIFNYLYLRTRG